MQIFMQIYLTIPYMLTSKLNAMVQYNDELKSVITNVSKDKYSKKHPPDSLLYSHILRDNFTVIEQ